LAREKNTHTLFKSFALLADRRPNQYHLLIVGDGSQRDQLQQLQTCGRPVTWRRYCSDALELARLYRAADLFVHPGVQETFGLVALESQACGTAVVGIRGSYMDRIILNDQQFWANDNSADALADAIENLGAQNLKEAGRALAHEIHERYAWPRVFERLFCIYREVCSKYSARGPQ
jgi:alpha-1,6-mannosyltransferase